MLYALTYAKKLQLFKTKTEFFHCSDFKVSSNEYTFSVL